MRQNLLHGTAWKAGETVYFPAGFFLRPHGYSNRNHAQPPLSLNKKTRLAQPAGGFYNFKCPRPAYAGFGKALEPGKSIVAGRFAGDARRPWRRIMGQIMPLAGLGRISSDFSPSLDGALRRAGWQVRPSRDREGNDGGRR